jgi:hypothetical protein
MGFVQFLHNAYFLNIGKLGTLIHRINPPSFRIGG